jgi:hypothetical protein
MGTPSPSTYQNSLVGLIYYDKVMRKGACDFDITQNFSANVLYQLPSRGDGLTKTIIGGWQVGGIVFTSTGVPFTLIQTGDVLVQQGLSFGVLPDVVPNCNPINRSYKTTGLNYINPSCFVFPTVPVGSPIAPLCNQGGTTPINGEVLCLNASPSMEFTLKLRNKVWPRASSLPSSWLSKRMIRPLPFPPPPGVLVMSPI